MPEPLSDEVEAKLRVILHQLGTLPLEDLRAAYRLGLAQRSEDSELLDYIMPLLELAEGDGDAIATRIGGALLLGLKGRAAIRAAKGE